MVFIPVMWRLHYPFILVAERAMHLPLIKIGGRAGVGGTCTFTNDFYSLKLHLDNYFANSYSIF
jgi:hypothetical protein